MIEDWKTTATVRRRGIGPVITALGAMAALTLGACGKISSGLGAAGAAPPQEFLSACVLGPMNGPAPFGDLTVADLLRILQKPSAKLTWEKGDSGWILRDAVGDQLTDTTHMSAFSLSELPPGTAAKVMGSEHVSCGPGAVMLGRLVLDGDEVEPRAIYVTALQFIGPYLEQKRASLAHTSSATAAVTDDILSADELDQIAGHEGVTTYASALAKAAAACKALVNPGTLDRGADGPEVSVAEIDESAMKAIAIFEMAPKHGHQLTPNEQACLKEARATDKEMRANLEEPGTGEAVK